LLLFLYPGSETRDPGWVKTGSGIRDKHPGSATLQYMVLVLGSVLKINFAVLVYRTWLFLNGFGKKCGIETEIIILDSDKIQTLFEREKL
jgi:hypothetical protein